MSKEFDAIRHSVVKIKNDASSLQQSLVNCIGNANGEAIALLRGRIEKVFKLLEVIETDCSGGTSCSNGVELMALMQRKNEANERMELVENEVREINGDLKRLRDKVESEPRINIPFVFPSKMTNGVHHFDLALDVQRAGHHKIEIRFKKGKGFSLYQLNPPKPHHVVMQCVVSGAINKTDELSWKDLPSDWQDEIVMEGDLYAGENRFSLDLTFAAEDSRGKTLQGGTWQYRNDKHRNDKRLMGGIQDDFNIEFWVDGVKSNIFGFKAIE